MEGSGWYGICADGTAPKEAGVYKTLKEQVYAAHKATDLAKNAINAEQMLRAQIVLADNAVEEALTAYNAMTGA